MPQQKGKKSVKPTKKVTKKVVKQEEEDIDAEEMMRQMALQNEQKAAEEPKKEEEKPIAKQEEKPVEKVEESNPAKETEAKEVKKVTKKKVSPAEMARRKAMEKLKKDKEEEERLAKEEKEKELAEEAALKKFQEEEAKRLKLEEERKAEEKRLAKERKQKKEADDKQKRIMMYINANSKVEGLIRENDTIVKKETSIAKEMKEFDEKMKEGKKRQKKEKVTKEVVESVEEVAQPFEETKEEEQITDDMNWEEMLEMEENKEKEIQERQDQLKKLEAERAEEKKRKEEEEKKKKEEEALAKARPKYRSPICCVLGHVDTGKTKILDKMRRTDVQKGEAGGITQQIGSTFFPLDAIEKMTEKMKEKTKLDFKIPGLLIMDTPGHESFTNLRSRGTSLCDIAVLVVDLMHGLEPQTIESINLLKQKNTPFVVALNKIDRCYQWKATDNGPFRDSFEKQSSDTKQEFQNRLKATISDFAAQGINSCLYYENKNIKDYVSLVPTSAITGEGIPDLVTVLIAMTQRLMLEKLTPSDELQATIMEVKTTEGHGTTIDVILVNGMLRRGDRIVVCGMQGPIVTSIRALLVPVPMKDIRVKTQYNVQEVVCAAQGVKISAQDLDNAIAGSSIAVCNDDDFLEETKKEVQSEFEKFQLNVNEKEGVFVQASSLGSLEALLRFLKESKIPVAGIGLGPIFKKDVMKTLIMKEKNPDYAIIMAFDVPVDKDAREYANDEKILIFTANIIYHLFDQFTAHMQKLEEAKRIAAENAGIVVWPCVAEILPQFVFNDRNPIICGVKILRGTLKMGCPISLPSRNNLDIGRVIGIENNNKPVEVGKVGEEVCIKIEPFSQSSIYTYKKHFDSKDLLYSKISRESLDLLKTRYGKDLTQDDIQLLVELKKTFNIF
ncbi:eukaryotic translation initiation factor 5B, putative [Entamoeba invadens IP1]|uniref:Eukaryotic translation initiation factor 5B n=1 Tax=Entamoeba invadens IP1 TaxID=370355 RepID=A0A0A1UEU7_ENTIV|nr:eukaryotic translation initiation factor 5B, putative [Entamoeba invadens IP1]ELP95003.1 eukaryotic translation initiation factor 5B, putative [Entamoeba invadens IP1]|eukprot:XP_004261774.1 eukaryotic translation initiation factor 5B, putative [Entamoeba invadens IP1]